MEVTVRTKSSLLTVDADTLEVARLVASTLGFVCDIEPMEPGKAKLTAVHTRTGATVRANGASVIKAAEKLIDLLAAR